MRWALLALVFFTSTVFAHSHEKGLEVPARERLALQPKARP